MSEPTAPGTLTRKIHDLEAEDRMRAQIAQRRQRLHHRLKDAFAGLPEGSPEAERAELVRGFLQFVADNIDSYATRTRVQNPHTGAVVDEEWVTLCGATIRALDVPSRIQRLVLELVDGVIPEVDLERRRMLSEAAGLGFAARASAADIKALDKKGILAAFGGKLLVDSKHLISEHTREETEAYFDAARRIAAELQASPYQTARDRKFLDLIRKRYQGGLVALVDAQRDVALGEIDQRDRSFPLLERVLRSMLERPFAADRSRSIDDWYIAARIAFQSETYVYSRIDEFRTDLKARMAELEGEPMLNPDATLEAATKPVADAIADLESFLESKGAEIAHQPVARLDVMQVVRENAALLAKPELVAKLDQWLANEELAVQFARYKVASFRRVEPDLRARLHQELVMWDELFRSAPLTVEQHVRLETHRDDLLAPLRERGEELPKDFGEAKMLLPFGGRVLPLLHTEDEFDAFQRWLTLVRAVYSDRTVSEISIPVVEPAEQTPRPGATPTPTPTPMDGTVTARWYPTLVDVRGELDPDAQPREVEGDIPGDRPQRGWLRRWFGD